MRSCFTLAHFSLTIIYTHKTDIKPQKKENCSTMKRLREQKEKPITTADEWGFVLVVQKKKHTRAQRELPESIINAPRPVTHNRAFLLQKKKTYGQRVIDLNRKASSRKERISRWDRCFNSGSINETAPETETVRLKKYWWELTPLFDIYYAGLSPVWGSVQPNSWGSMQSWTVSNRCQHLPTTSTLIPGWYTEKGVHSKSYMGPLEVLV